ncbi:hypothetical protein HAX54_048346, partial [Datura stramonium]|nr:hypothetical protein [Datura stramonium]
FEPVNWAYSWVAGGRTGKMPIPTGGRRSSTGGGTRLQSTASNPRFTGTPRVKTRKMSVWHPMNTVTLVYCKGLATNRHLAGLHLHSAGVMPVLPTLNS